MPNSIPPMSDNITPTPNNDETAGARFARWATWILIAACGVFFVVYAAMFH